MPKLEVNTPGKRKSSASERNSAKKAKLEESKLSPKQRQNGKKATPSKNMGKTTVKAIIEEKSKQISTDQEVKKKAKTLVQQTVVVQPKKKTNLKVPPAKRPHEDSNDEEEEDSDGEEEEEDSDGEEEEASDVDQTAEEGDDSDEELEQNDADNDEDEEGGEDEGQKRPAATNKSQSESDSLNGTSDKRFTLFISNIPRDATEQDMRQHFEKVDVEIAQCHLGMDMSNNQHRGYGFLQVVGDVAYKKCLSAHQSELKGQKINVLEQQDGNNDDRIVVFITRLPLEATEEDIMHHFTEVGGDIIDLRLQKKRKPEVHKGYGYLELKTSNAFEKCLSIDMTELKGELIRVRPEQKPRKQDVEEEENEKKITLFVSNIPRDATKEDVIQHFAEIGDDFIDFNLLMDKNSNQNRGYGYIEVKNDEKCLSLHRSDLKGQQIDVLPPPKVDTAKKHMVYVGGIAFEATEEDVMQHFAEIGCDIINFRFTKDRSPNRHRGFGFLAVKTEDALKKCLSFNGSHLKGRQLNVRQDMNLVLKKLKPLNHKGPKSKPSKSKKTA